MSVWAGLSFNLVWKCPIGTCILCKNRSAGTRTAGGAEGNMNDSEVRISIKGLRPGMYVVRLDRPWLETPHKMQGFKLENQGDVDEVARYSRYVYIDPRRGSAPDPDYIIPDGAGRDKPLKEALPSMGSVTYENVTSLTQEMREARQAQDRLQSATQEVLADLEEGRDLDLEALRDGVKAMIDSIVRNPEALAWLSKIKVTDIYTYHHSLGASIWAATFARHLGLPRKEIELLALGGLLLDVGKIRLPKELLRAESRLSPDQVEAMKKHVDYSVEMLQKTPDIEPKVLSMVATHHERYDGSGYPQGLSGEEIPLFGRIAGIVDTYDAITSVRAYAKPMSPHGAVALLYDWRGVDFQAELVEQFIQAIGIYPTGTLVELSTGEVGVITSLNGIKRLRPRVMVLLDAGKKPLTDFREVDLMVETETEDGKRLDIKRGLPPGSYGIDPEELFL